MVVPHEQARPCRPWLAHPVLFAWAPVLLLYAHNMAELHLGELLLPLLLATAAALAVWGLLRALLRDGTKAGVLASCFWLWFSSFGPVHSLATRLSELVCPTLLLVYALAWPALLVLALDRKWGARHVSAALNLMAVGLVLFSAARIGVYEWRRARAPASALSSGSLPRPAGARQGEAPNIYFLVLDGYGREDVLHDLYHCDNRDFLRSLEGEGFQVAPRARANYAQTALSLASCLNLRYLEELPRLLGPKATDRTPLGRAIDNNEMARFLRASGYRIVAFASGYGGTEMRSADSYQRGRAGVSEFQSSLLEITPLPHLMRLLGVTGETDAHTRARQVLYTYDHLAQAGQSARPVFVFAHIIAPHPPFIFRADGSLKNDLPSAGFQDDTDLLGGREAYVQGYREQIEFITARTRRAIQEILARAPRPTVILLLSDHGPASRLVLYDVRQTDLRERFGILLALRLPGKDLRINDDLSPVNACRLVLREYLGADLPPLPSRSYFSNFDAPYRFTEVTDAQGRFRPFGPSGTKGR